jgi:hypothetical protein
MKTKTKPTAVAATAAPVAPAAGLKRINLAGISTKAPAAKAAKTYPLLPDSDGQVAALVNGIVEKAEQLEAIEGALEIEKAELIAIAKPFYFAHHAGQMAVAKGCRGRRRSWSPGSPERMEGRPLPCSPPASQSLRAIFDVLPWRTPAPRLCRPIFVRRSPAAVGRMGRAARGNPRRRRSATCASGGSRTRV